MQVTHDSLFAATTTLEDLRAIGTVFAKMTPAQLDKLAKRANPNGAHAAQRHQPDYMVLRGAIAKKLAEGEHGAAYKAGGLEYVTPSEQAAAAAAKAAGEQQGQQQGAPQGDQQQGAQGAKKGQHSGPYWVAKRPGTKSTEATDPTKWELWQHVWACNSFEEFFKACPAKGTRSSGKPITASSTINWALKRGWIVAGTKPAAEHGQQQGQQEQQKQAA